MTATNYQRGFRFECSTRDALTAAGFEVVRAAGSHTKIDIVAFREVVWFVQCKRNGVIGPADRAELIRLAALVDAVPVVAFKIAGIAAPQFKRLLGPGAKDFHPLGLKESAA